MSLHMLILNVIYWVQFEQDNNEMQQKMNLHISFLHFVLLYRLYNVN